MTSFLPTLTRFSRQRVCCAPCSAFGQVRSIGGRSELHAEVLTETPAQQNKRPTFQGLGLHPPIVSALHAGFPNIQYPTETQAKFIPAILSGKDVLLKDKTGSGKSFGLVVALLNKPRIRSKGSGKDGKFGEQRHITSLILLPHRDLAHQLYHWIERMTAASADSPPPLPSIAQVLVRDGASHMTTGLNNLRTSPPHILIATPQALLDVWKEDPEALQLNHLSSVVVDEVDYLVETVSLKDPKKSFHKSLIKSNRKLLAHPGITRQILNMIYEKRIARNRQRQDEPGAVQHRRRSGEVDDFPASPQLILSSATLRRHLKNYLFDESGWLNRDNLLKVTGTPDGVKEETLPSLRDELGGTDIAHSILVVSEGRIRNTQGAIRRSTPDPETRENGVETAERLFAPSATLEPPSVDPQLAEKYANKTSPFNPDVFEAIATAFALDVPSVGLLVLPSSAPVQRAVYELRELGVNAHSLDLLETTKGRSHLLSGGGQEEENPTLLVCTLATTRGLDLPELTHVFHVGVPGGGGVTGRTVDEYLHVAGRVGRFGRGGKVITVVESAGDELKMERVLKTADMGAVPFEAFD